ncbi:hypothetical protein SNE40_004605 [Patella caerulea]|uniref:Stathmin n=1 Tax=Patella caerulea TaxID=87958 RepID=A0AAN8K3C5_PATCE
MSQVCNWLSVFLCLRESTKKPIYHKVHPNRGAFDAVILWKGKEGAKEKVGGLAYEVILKPATVNEAPLRPVTPPKEKVISEADILNKLKKAEERRLSLEAQRLEQLAKERAKAQEIVAKAQEESKIFSEETEKKLRKAMEANKENRETQINALRERLREHATHIQEVCKASESMNRASEEKIITKMETALKNREEQYRALQERLQEHERRIEEVRRNKQNIEQQVVSEGQA